jgi:hypothetical protein
MQTPRKELKATTGSLVRISTRRSLWRTALRILITALIAMILRPQLYDTDMDDSSDRPRLSDHAPALTIVRHITKRFKPMLKKVETELDVGGVDWAKAGDKTTDLSFLSV